MRFDLEAAGVKSLAALLEKTEQGKMASATSGIQGWKGTLFGEHYAAWSWQASGTEQISHEAWSIAAIAPSAPFAMAELLPPEVWKGISILLEAAK